MRIIDPLLMEFDRESVTTKTLLSRVPDDKLGWRPHAKSMTLGKLGMHLATIPAWIGSSLLGDGFDIAGGAADFSPKDPQGTAEILETFDRAAGQVKAAMSQLDDAAAMGMWTLTRNGATLMAMPRVAYVRTILLNHSYHHRGQLSVYLRLLDVPVPSIYGPSADENPFA